MHYICVRQLPIIRYFSLPLEYYNIQSNEKKNQRMYTLYETREEGSYAVFTTDVEWN